MIAALCAAGMAITWWKLSHVPPPAAVRFKLDFASGRRVEDALSHPIAISSDGRTIAYVGGGDQGRAIFVRRLGDLDARVVPGTEQASSVELSRDGQSLSFYGAGGRIRRASLNGGAATVVADAARWLGSAWGPNGELVYAALGGIWRVAAEGSTPMLIAKPDSAHGELVLASPYVLPDGKTVLFMTLASAANSVPHLGAVSVTGTGRRLLPLTGMNVIGFADGTLFYGDGTGAINAVRFDSRSLDVHGEPVRVIEGIRIRNNLAGLSAAMSDDGTLIYVRGRGTPHLALLDRTGKSLDESSERQNFAAPTWSPDGSRIAVGSGRVFDASSLWVYDVASKVFSRMITQRDAFRPAWSGDGKRIAFITTNSTVWWTRADGSSTEELFLEMPGELLREVVFSPDGRFAVVRTDTRPGRSTARDLYLLPLNGERKAVPIVQGPGTDIFPVISPDSRWLAYQSDETGRYEIYVRPLALAGGRTQVSTDGGTEPRWAPNGTHIVYRSNNAFRSAALNVGTDAITVTSRDSLFADPFETSDVSRQNYDISRDGRFVVVRGAAEGAEVVVVTNWLSEVRSKLKDR